VNTRPKVDPFFLHKPKAPFQNAFVKLKVRNAVPKQPADPVGALEYRHLVPQPTKFLGGGKPAWPRADYGYAISRTTAWRNWFDQSLGECLLDDILLDYLNCNGVVDQPEDAGTLARRRTHPSRKLREIVCFMQ